MLLSFHFILGGFPNGHHSCSFSNLLVFTSHSDTLHTSRDAPIYQVMDKELAIVLSNKMTLLPWGRREDITDEAGEETVVGNPLDCLPTEGKQHLVHVVNWADNQEET
jgi:hypothetical protein